MRHIEGDYGAVVDDFVTWFRGLLLARSDRALLAGHPGRVLWLTGLSGAGNSKIANALAIELRRQGMRALTFDALQARARTGQGSDRCRLF